MIPKLILSNSFDFDGPSVSLVPLHRRGIDDQWMRKHASFAGMFAPFLDELKPQKGKTVIHVIAVGDEEMYGPNRNGDGFSRADNIKAHPSFISNGHVFKHHKNDDPFKAVGDVMKSAHNAQMSRIELLLGLDNNKCRREVEALESGEDLPVSMGSMQDYDVCSICDHKAPTAKDHCGHIKNMLGQVLEDGRRVYMKNPNPKYFDISLVFKPADRIAYTLRKVASACVGGHELAEIYGLRPANNSKIATMRALAEMYKEVPMHLRKVTEPTDVSDETMGELKKQAQIHGVEHLLQFLSSNGWLLSGKDFGDVMGHPSPCGCQAAVDDFGDVEDVISDHTEVEAFENPGADPYVSLSDSARGNLRESCGMGDDESGGRAMRIVIVKPTKTAGAILDPQEAKGFADLYCHYKLAFANKHRDRKDVLRSVAVSF